MVIRLLGTVDQEASLHPPRKRIMEVGNSPRKDPSRPFSSTNRVLSTSMFVVGSVLFYALQIHVSSYASLSVFFQNTFVRLSQFGTSGYGSYLRSTCALPKWNHLPRRAAAQALKTLFATKLEHDPRRPDFGSLLLFQRARSGFFRSPFFGRDWNRAKGRILELRKRHFPSKVRKVTYLKLTKEYHFFGGRESSLDYMMSSGPLFNLLGHMAHTPCQRAYQEYPGCLISRTLHPSTGWN